ncbi:epimerase [Dictyobacter sp. S3.2.2.5]|uniref:Epimerase n=1 Tax=Dictyobacter halimunensis TaxID=3026934 RepID=A0ABQ6FKH7_9CHLR|nr:epimerase [Dictyobacter sp. S3.2.2.5]
MNNIAKELHVIFGSGPVGTTLADELLARGKQVRIVNRSGKGQVTDGVELVVGDASKLEQVQELAQGAAVMYNCTHAPYHTWPETLPRLQENMIEGAATTGARLIVIDTLYMYGETHGEPMTEATPHIATSRKGRLRAELAWGYLQAYRTGKARVAIGRAADFFGPRVLNSSLGEYVFPTILSDQPALTMGNIDLPHSYSYMPDIARGLATLGEREQALGRDWLLPVNPAISTREVFRIIGEVIGQQPQIFNVPTMEQIQTMGIMDETFAREYAELFYQYTEPQIVDSRTFTQTFDLQPTPFEDAIRATVAWYRGYTQATNVRA